LQREPEGKRPYILNEKEDIREEKEDFLSQVTGQRSCGFDASQDVNARESITQS
jgi:hypothetical protein